MILAIDLCNNQKSIAIFWPRKIEKYSTWHSNKVDPLSKIDQLLNQNQFQKEDVKYIVVNRGPGSFTGVRLGLVIANIWANFKNIPTLGISKKNFNITELAKYGYQQRKKMKINQMILPYYGKRPNIT